MAEDRKDQDPVPEDDATPRVLEEPGTGEETRGEETRGEAAKGASHREVPDWEIETEPENPWLRGLWMVVLAILFGVGEMILFIAAVFQFLWLIFAKEKNANIADFGKELADWLARVALFQTGTTEEKPFPFARWGSAE